MAEHSMIGPEPPAMIETNAQFGKPLVGTAAVVGSADISLIWQQQQQELCLAPARP